MTDFTEDRELVFTRLIDAKRRSVFRCWTEPALLKQWFAPAPYTVVDAHLDLRAGGANRITMRGTDGEVMPNNGVYLEVEADTRIVFTDAFSEGWQPRDGAPFMVATISLSDEDGKTRYTATVRHWTLEAKRQHEEMGFKVGWGICADQLETIAKSL
jgi:uncharacterized protein YndB with AHSA1/START domain